MHLMVALCTFGRLFYLITNAYGSKQLVPKIVSLILKFAMFPCITSSFILLFTIFLRLTKVQLVARNIFKPWLIVLIIFINFLLGYTADIIAVTLVNGMVFMFLCDSYFSTWGVVFSSAYLYVFSRVFTNVVVNRKKLNEIGKEEPSKSGDKSCATRAPQLDTEIPLAGKVAIAAAFAFISIGLINIYRLIMLLVNLSVDIIPAADPWYWWAYNTIMRGLEVFMNATILFVASLPFYH